MAIRFWRYVEKSDGCWLWRGATNGRYGKISRGVGLGLIGAHRASWEIHFGPIPEGLYICHLCDVPLCVRPSHLTLGTPEENNLDKLAKGRGDVPLGMAHWRAKITTAQVEEIRSMIEAGMLQREVAALFGLNRATVSKIVRLKGRRDG